MATTTKVTLKLLIDKKSNRVLFAEAGKEFVDFLFSILSLPLGTVIRLLSKDKMVGCLGNLYQSIEELDDTFIQQSTSKDIVLNPKVQLYTADTNLLLTGCDNSNGTSATGKVYLCQYYTNGHRYFADNPQAICPGCDNRMNIGVTFVPKPVVEGNGGGNQNSEAAGKKSDQKGGLGVVTYMVMDDLEVKPMSTISSLTLLSKFNIQQVGALEERVIELGMDEGLNLLKASLQCKTVLTSVFLGV
ncbi:hypothetical protein LINPERPRIM_LOCUS13566 [Linum perenne]